MYITRHLEEQIILNSKFYPVIMVCGQRQVGKSTMLYHIMEPERRYVSLDDYNARRLAQTDPGLFFETYGAPLLIDEFQRVPELLLEMKRIVDAKALAGEDNHGMYWLTGSQKFAMMKGVAESLAGRIGIFDLAGLSNAEIEGYPAEVFRADIHSLQKRFAYAQKKNVQELYQDIFRGGMPTIVTTAIDRERYYADYINTYVERDVKELARVGKLSVFYDFLVYMAARTSKSLVYSEIANNLGISAPTAKEWVSILERSGIIYLLKPYYNNITSRLIKTPKVYFMDTGLAAYLCRWPSAEVLEKSAMDGAFLETYVITEIIKSYYSAGKQSNFYYYRDVDKKEIDFLIMEGEKVYPLEIKKSKNPLHADKNFKVLEKFNLQIEPGVILCMNDELVPYNRETWLCPVFAL